MDARSIGWHKGVRPGAAPARESSGETEWPLQSTKHDPVPAVHLDPMRVFGIDCGTEVTGIRRRRVGRSPRDEPRCSSAPWARSAWRRRKPARAPGPGLPRTDRRTGALAARCCGHRRGLLLGECKIGSEAGPGARRGAAGGGAAGIPLAEYAPLKIKSSVVGYGLAKKEQVQFMVARLLELAEVPAAGRRGRRAGHRHLPHPHGADAGAAGGRAMRDIGLWRSLWLAHLAAGRARSAAGHAAPAPGAIPSFQVDFSNPGLSPPQWTLVLHPDGSGHFVRRWASSQGRHEGD